MGDHGIEADAKLLRRRYTRFALYDRGSPRVHIVCTENLIGNGVLPGLVRGGFCFLSDGLAIQQVNTMIDEFYHNS